MSNIQKLSPRLAMVESLVAGFVAEQADSESGFTIADIGTDHAYLATALLEHGLARDVIASDLNAGPLQAAERTVTDCGLESQIELRQGDGLQVLAPGEADIVCVAGMGGALMCDMLKAADKAVLKQIRALVLQPQNAEMELRRWLYGHYWHIADEQLTVDDGRIYVALRAEHGRQKMPSPLELLVGPVLLAKQPPLLEHHIETMVFRGRQILSGMERSPRAVKTRKYQQVKELMAELEDLL